MLSRKDKEEIKGIIQTELKAALGRTIQIEKGPRQQGDAETRREIEDVDIISWLILYIPRIEAALRGVQEDVDRTVNTVDAQTGQIQAMGQVLLSAEKSLKSVAALSDVVRKIRYIQETNPLPTLRALENDESDS